MVTDKLSSFLSPSLSTLSLSSLSLFSSAHFLWPRLSRFFSLLLNMANAPASTDTWEITISVWKKRKEDKKKVNANWVRTVERRRERADQTSQQKGRHSCPYASFCVCIINSHFWHFRVSLSNWVDFGSLFFFFKSWAIQTEITQANCLYAVSAIVFVYKTSHPLIDMITLWLNCLLGEFCLFAV